MSISAQVGVMIPTNVVEVGNEISSDQLAAITNASGATAANPFATNNQITSVDASKAMLLSSTVIGIGGDNTSHYWGGTPPLFVGDLSLNFGITDGSNNYHAAALVTGNTIYYSGSWAVSGDFTISVNGSSSQFVITP